MSNRPLQRFLIDSKLRLAAGGLEYAEVVALDDMIVTLEECMRVAQRYQKQADAGATTEGADTRLDENGVRE